MVILQKNSANSSGFNFNTNEPIIAVVKKNPSVLDRLYQWLSAQVSSSPEGAGIIGDKSLLMIDDEADHASINTNKPEWKPTRINSQIRDILNVFRRSGYVGYTATPFANIFIPINKDDLFPRDFIINIPSPSNYIGPEKVFGFRFLEEDEPSDDVLPIVHRIEDYALFVPDRHKKDDQLPSAIPDSLKLAIRCFILTCAIRRLRGQTSVHNSMLVHVSRFQRWQSHITELIQNQFDYYRMGIDQNDKDTLDLFRSTFEEDQSSYKSYCSASSQILDSSLSNIDPGIDVHSWKDVLPNLHEAASRIFVRQMHGGSRDVLDYYDHKEGLSVIVIGGNKLSRGLTLEGLSISYYLRSSRMYDTLMQMGRWFGYRPKYIDLCRLFTTRELNEHFCHITHASEELREEFDIMADVAGSTPEQYALKVRTHPGVLQISATNKIRMATNVRLSWSGRLIESYELLKSQNATTQNWEHTKSHFRSYPGKYETKGNSLLWSDVSVNRITDFLQGLVTPENLKAYDPSNLVRFINAQIPNGELTHWRVALMSKHNATRPPEILRIGTKSVNIGCFIRTQDDNNSGPDIYYLKKSHIISPRHEFIDLSEEAYTHAMELTREHRLKNNIEDEPSYPNGEIVRNLIRDPKNPLLLVYLLDPLSAKMAQESIPFVGFAISFPGSSFNEFVTYAVHEQLLDHLYIDDETEDFEDLDEN